MSSSAALEAGLAFALNYIFELQIDDLALVKFAQKAENEFVGVQCGIMDQYINIFGKQDNVLRIDCRSLEYKYYPFAFHSISRSFSLIHVSRIHWHRQNIIEEEKNAVRELRS